MDKRAILVGMGLWMTLLGLGMVWATNPGVRPPAPVLARITPEETARAFPLRLASLPAGDQGVATHMRRVDEALEAGEEPAPRAFDYEEWAFREVRARFAAFFVVWVLSGFVILWLARRAFRG
jgi:hypothetical protein